MKVNVSEAEREALDYMVVMAEWTGHEFVKEDRFLKIFMHQNRTGQGYCYSRDWAQAGPIIERDEIELHVIPEIRAPENWGNCKAEDKWCANIWPQDEDLIKVSGPTPLIAAMRCFVASRLGYDVDVPEEICR